MTRKNVNFRLSESALAWVDSLVEEYKLTRSEVLRVVFNVASKDPEKIVQALKERM